MSSRTRGLSALLLLGLALAGGGVVAGGEAPLADAGLDQRVDRGATVLLDGTGSRAPDGRITDYEWSVRAPDGSTVRPADPDSARTRFVARQRGRYVVTLTVTDDEGRTATDTLYVDVDRVGTPRESTPTATPAPGGTETPTPETAATPTPTPTRDREVRTPKPEEPPEPVTPDGPIEVDGTDGGSGGGEGGDGASTTTSPSGGGIDCETGTWVPIVGCTTAPTIEAPEVNVPPAAQLAGDDRVTRGSIHEYEVNIYDESPENALVEWDDGTVRRSKSHVFTAPRGSTVTLSATVHDGEGATVPVSETVRIVDERTNQPPQVKIQGPNRACVGETVAVDGVVTASEKRDQVVDTTWHDSPKFVPQAAGRYDVRLSATDTKGQVGDDIHTVFVYRDGACEASNEVVTTGPNRTDKLLIDADDEDIELTGGDAGVQEARGMSTGPLGGFGRTMAAGADSVVYETVAGNRETIRTWVSNDVAHRIQSRTGIKDESIADAKGVRINGQEVLRGAVVRDPVETSNERILLVIQIGKDNHGTLDSISSPLDRKETRQAKTRFETVRQSAEQKAKAALQVQNRTNQSLSAAIVTTERGPESRETVSNGSRESSLTVDQNRSFTNSTDMAKDAVSDPISATIGSTTEQFDVDVPSVADSASVPADTSDPVGVITGAADSFAESVMSGNDGSVGSDTAQSGSATESTDSEGGQTDQAAPEFDDGASGRDSETPVTNTDDSTPEIESSSDDTGSMPVNVEEENTEGDESKSQADAGGTTDSESADSSDDTIGPLEAVQDAFGELLGSDDDSESSSSDQGDSDNGGLSVGGGGSPWGDII